MKRNALAPSLRGTSLLSPHFPCNFGNRLTLAHLCNCGTINSSSASSRQPTSPTNSSRFRVAHVPGKYLAQHVVHGPSLKSTSEIMASFRQSHKGLEDGSARERLQFWVKPNRVLS